MRALQEQAATERATRDAAVKAAEAAAAVQKRIADIAKLPSVRDQMASEKKCIDYSDAVIAREREIGREVGYVDMNALHDAGANKIACQRNYSALAACVKSKSARCAADYYDRDRAWAAAAAKDSSIPYPGPR